MRQVVEIRPQPGPQELFLSHPADIVIYGGGAGGGKTFGTLLDPLRDISNPGFGAVIFRRELEMVTNEGGLWDESMNLYSALNAKPNNSKLMWTFPSGARIGFDGVKAEYDVLKHQGSQFAALYFEELIHFTEYQFWYLQSRCRTTCGIRPRVRATLNPDPTSWVFGLLAPWVDPDWEGERAKSGETLWFVREYGKVRWVPEGTPKARSLTFIKALLSDNKILERNNPDYRAFLESLDEVERARLLDGEWRLPSTNGLWNLDVLAKCKGKPPAGVQYVRTVIFVDPGNFTSEKTADMTGIIVASIGTDGIKYVRNDFSDHLTPMKLASTLAKIHAHYGGSILYESNQGGEFVKAAIQNVVTGVVVRGVWSKGKKEHRATAPLSAYEIGAVKHEYDFAALEYEMTAWNPYNKKLPSPNRIDALCGALNELMKGGGNEPSEVKMMKVGEMVI